MKDEKRYDLWELLSSEGDMAEQIISIHIGCQKMKVSSEGCMHVWEQVMEPGRDEGGGGPEGVRAEIHNYLVREVWPVGMMSESHFDDKVKVTPSKAHFGQRQENEKRPEKQ